MGEIKIKEFIRRLWKEKILKFDFLDEKEKEVVYQIGLHFEEDVSFLYQLNETLIEKGDYIEDEQSGLRYKREQSWHVVTDKDQDVLFRKENLKEVIFSIIDLFEEVYPLGSVVNLKKDYLKQVIGGNEVKHVPVVITQRFLYQEKDAHYVPYAGVMYPVGMLGEEVIHFTKALVDEVVHWGYHDKEEEGYVALMKREIVLEKGMHSYAFASKKSYEKEKV